MNLDSIKKLGITNIGDPFIIRVDKTYYMYATSFVDGFYAWKSTDLKNWSAPKQVYKKGARSFGSSDFWAPEVVCRNGKYIMHYTARRAVDDTLYIGVAVSDAPMGDFIDVYDKKPMFDFGYAVIDAHVLIDGDKRYLFFDRDCSQYIVDGNHESHFLAVELDETLS
jgi:beta-xylosidase